MHSRPHQALAISAAFGAVAALAVVLTVRPATAQAADRPPNFVVIFADDLGYGDLRCFGHPTIATPNLDRMAAEGMKLTQFYSAAPVCTPSRAALMTGRLPVRSGMCSDRRRVLFPNSTGGIPAQEVTLAEALKARGYATACIGKWHLGHLPPYLPTANGFDTYFGIPYSNDMDRLADSPKGRQAFLHPKPEYFNVPLMRNTQIIERPANQNTITRRYAQEAIKFIKANKDKPFFVYLPHSMPHVPLFRSKEFENVSLRGLFGDVIQEVDWAVGQVLDTLRSEGLADNTLVWFTSDNGPWLIFDAMGGSAGPLRDGKGSTWEGGMREPTLAWWPGKIKPGRISAELGSTMDIYTTCITLAGGKVPTDRQVDGLDLTPMLLGTGHSPRDSMFYYRGTRLFAVRKGHFKAHFMTQIGYGAPRPDVHDPPLLFNLDVDPGEHWNLAKDHPDVLADIRKLVEQHQAKLKPGKPQLE